MTTSNLLIKYPLDLTGQSPDNLVPNEPHTAPREQARGFGLNYGGFYTKSLRIVHVNTGRPLVKGTDYICLELIERAFEASGQEVCAAIQITNDQLDGEFLVTYQAIGGEFSTNVDVINALLAALALDNRPVKWGDLIGLPDAFPPEGHYHTPDDLYGFEYLVEALERVRSAIMLGDYYDHEEIRQRIENLKAFLLNEDSKVIAMLQKHLEDENNPHNTTADQVGLGLVQNYTIANQAEAEAGTLNDRYMTPLRVAQAIAKIAGTILNQHINDTNNPHATTKDQVGLGLVQNYGIATQAEAVAGASNTTYMTPLRVAQAVQSMVGSSLTSHINNRSNPHSTTKAQVGLGLVENYAIATQAEAVAGVSNTTYMTPLRVAQMVQALSGSSIASHLLDKANPHATTKAQVGLGLVQNYAIATQAEAQAGTSNTTYMTPLRVSEMIQALSGQSIAGHLADKANPHGTTKAQVGLGLVENFPIATQAEAVAGTSNTAYMTPLRVAQMVQALSGQSIAGHLLDKANPHSTTKAQVGLGLVENYAIATQAEAVAGVSNTTYMTPLRVAQMVQALSGQSIAGHLLDKANPHQTTATQVGLGLVQNYAIATVAEAQAGTSNTTYMTPLRVAQMIQAMSGSSLAGHLADRGNPHGVTAAQVGLGNVQNYQMATVAEAQGGLSADRYMSPMLVNAAIQKIVGDGWIRKSMLCDTALGWQGIYNHIPWMDSTGTVRLGRIVYFYDHNSKTPQAILEIRTPSFSPYPVSSDKGAEFHISGYLNCIDTYHRSDLRDKVDVAELDWDRADSILTGIRNGITYGLINAYDKTAGLAAQVVQKYYPEAVVEILNGDGEPRLAIRDGALIGLLVSGYNHHDSVLKQQAEQITRLEKQLESVIEINSSLARRLEDLEEK